MANIIPKVPVIGDPNHQTGGESLKGRSRPPPRSQDLLPHFLSSFSLFLGPWEERKEANLLQSISSPLRRQESSELGRGNAPVILLI